MLGSFQVYILGLTALLVDDPVQVHFCCHPRLIPFVAAVIICASELDAALDLRCRDHAMSLHANAGSARRIDQLAQTSTGQRA